MSFQYSYFADPIILRSLYPGFNVVANQLEYSPYSAVNDMRSDAFECFPSQLIREMSVLKG